MFGGVWGEASEKLKGFVFHKLIYGGLGHWLVKKIAHTVLVETIASIRYCVWGLLVERQPMGSRGTVPGGVWGQSPQKLNGFCPP